MRRLLLRARKCAKRFTGIINLHSSPIGSPYPHFQIKVKRRGSDELSNSPKVVQPVAGRVKILSTTILYLDFLSENKMKEKLCELNFAHLATCGLTLINLVQ